MRRNRIPIYLIPVSILALGTGCDSSPSGPSPDDVTAIEIEGSTDGLRVGQTRAFTAIVFLTSQTTTEELDVEWSSVTPDVVGIQTDGLARALSPGTGIIQARVGSQTAQVSFTVLSEDAPEVEEIEPDVFSDGQLAVIRGRNFGVSVSDNQVALDGLMLEVLQSSATILEVRVPEGICLPDGPVVGTVTVAGESVEFVHAYEGPAAQDLASGQLEVVRGAETLCIRLPESTSSSQYLVGVQSTSLVEGAVTDVRLDIGVPAGAPAVLPLPEPSISFAQAVGARSARHRLAQRRAAHQASHPDALPHSAGHHEAHQRFHERFMEANAPLVDRLVNEQTAAYNAGPGHQMAAAARATTANATVPGGAQVGDTLQVRFPEIDENSFQVTCSGFQNLDVAVRVRSQHFFVVEDLDNPSGGYTTADFEEAVNFLESMTRPRLEEHFGAFTDLDGNGRVVLVFSQEVNRIGPLGLVNPLDFFPPDNCAASNGGEYLFNQVPDPSGSVGRQVSRDDALSGLDQLNAHELTHVIQSGRRISEGRPSMSVWPSESQAVLGEEIVGWEELGFSAGQDLGAEVAFFGTGEDSSDTEWFFNRFADLAFYYGFAGANSPQASGAPQGCGWLGRRDSSGPCDYSRLAYGVGWSFLRWVTDQYGPEREGSREALHRAWIDSPGANMPDLAELVAEDRRDLLAHWAATLWTDNRPGMADRLQFPSWNLRSVESGLIDQATLQPEMSSFQSVSFDLQVASAASSYLLVSGSSRPSSVFRVRGADGVPPAPSEIQLWVVKVP